MIAHRHAPKQTKAEADRIRRMLAMGCIICKEFGGWRVAEVHHIVEGNQRLGHWYTLPLCPGHHRGVWTLYNGPRIALSDGSKLFEEAFGTERELWKRVQDELKLPYFWPTTKILPRRLTCSSSDVGSTSQS